jgi:hypothetical protein
MGVLSALVWLVALVELVALVAAELVVLEVQPEHLVLVLVVA